MEHFSTLSVQCFTKTSPKNILWSVRLVSTENKTLKKLEIVDDPEEILLKKRLEVISQCRHRNKYKLMTESNKKDRVIT